MSARILAWPEPLKAKALSRIREHKLQAVERNFRLVRNPEPFNLETYAEWR